MNRESQWEQEQIILQYESLWRQDNRPGLPEFLAGLGRHPPPGTVGELCRVDLEHRVRSGQNVDAADYFQAFPDAFPEAGSQQDFVRYFEEVSKIPKPRPSTFNGGNAAATETGGATCLPTGFPAGTRIDHYEIVRPAGSGAFSHVYEARDTALRRNVALKFLSPQPQEKSALRQRLLREAHTVAVLDHPGIVPVYGVGNWNGCDYIVSRLVPGQSLDQQLSEASVSPRRAAEIARDLALSLDHAHQLGIVHRDIKPANVMMESGRPMLLDFGLAHFHDEQTQLTMAGDVIGTPAYMPPEQAEGRSFMADGRSDIYSLGVLLYRMVCGQLPFRGTTTEIISQAIHRDPVPPGRVVRGVDHDLETIVIKCMEKEPAARYATGGLLADDLQRYLDGMPILARRTGFAGRTSKWIRRRPVAAAVLATLVLILAALGGALSQLNSVRHQRDRAVAAENAANQARAETQSLLSQTAASAGQLAMQRGRWSSALEHFDQALEEHNVANRDSLVWQRLSTLVSMRKINLAREAFADIADSMPASASDPVFLYWQAELQLESDPTDGRCEALFERAIQAGLPAAEELYAQGMLANNSEAAAESFRAALLSDPFHHRARRELVLLLISLARLEEAADESGVASQMFPEDPDFSLFQSLILALQGKLGDARARLRKTGLPREETGKWNSALKFVHDIPLILQVFPDADNFDPTRLTDTGNRLNGEIVPLFAARGWVFPPRIARRFGHLLAQLAEFSPTESMETATNESRQLALMLEELADVHAEGTLLLLRSYVEFSNLGILSGDFRNLDDSQISGLENMRDNYRKCLDRRFLLDYDRQDVWKGIYLASMLLAQYANRDVELNRETFVDAVSHIETSESVSLPHVRAYVITLLEAGAIDQASRWSEYWVQRTGRKDFDAFWHLMITAQRQQDWLRLEQLGREGRELFPENVELANFHQHALDKIRDVLAFEAGESSDDDSKQE